MRRPSHTTGGGRGFPLVVVAAAVVAAVVFPTRRRLLCFIGSSGSYGLGRRSSPVAMSGSPFSETVKERYPSSGPPTFHQTWADYTRYALGIEDYGPDYDPESDPRNRMNSLDNMPIAQILDRKRSLGIDFGPKFTGMALSLGGVSTIAMGTLQTGEDWTDLTLAIAQIASTRRCFDIVVGLPLEKDGSEGKIAKLVRHFTQMLTDSVLLLLGTGVSVFLWDERFSTTYAAMRLTQRATVAGMPFKSWLDGQKGLNFQAKALLDAEAARAILEHWLEKDLVTNKLNKEKSERVPPSRKACMEYLRSRRTTALKPPKRPTEPAGPGKEGWEFDEAHPRSDEMTAEDYFNQVNQYNALIQGNGIFSNPEAEKAAKRAEDEKWKQQNFERNLKQDVAVIQRAKDRFKSAGTNVKENYVSLGKNQYEPDIDSGNTMKEKAQSMTVSPTKGKSGRKR